MRLSELLGAPVRDADGREVGSVTDVRLVQDGPLVGPVGAAFAIDGLIVTPGRAGSYFGYERTGAEGPWLLGAVFRYLHRRARFVPWEDVAVVAGGSVTLRARIDDLSPVPPIGS